MNARAQPTGAERSVLQPQVFARKATGLVREASLKDVFAFNVNMQNVYIGVVFSLLLIPPLYPNANIYLATLLAWIIALPVSYVYAKLGATFPRSGGDYVFVSRIVHPALAFTSNLSYCIWGAFYIGVSGVFLGVYGLAPLFRVLGAYLGSKGLAAAGNWFAGPTGEFVMAAGLIVLFVTIFAVGGMRLYFKIQAVNFTFASVMLGLVVAWGFIASRSGALAALDQQITALGGKALSSLAEPGAGGFSWKETTFAAIWPWLAFNSAIYSTYMGGEVKRADRHQVLGIMGALAWAAAWMLLATWAMYDLFGGGFWANVGAADPAQFGLSTTPTFGEISGYALGNVLVATLVMIGLVLWTYVWIAPYTVLLTRSMLAWSLDRLGPRQLAEVHPKWHSPVKGLLTILVLGVITSALYAYGNLSVLTGTVGITASMIVVAVAGILLPYRNPQLWSSSPAAGRVAGLPTISLAGLISLPLLGLIEWALLADANSGTSLVASPQVVVYVTIIFLVGLPIYFGIMAFQKRRGIDVDLAYKEIPPE
jgi:APA family basic amino acid/polyamine antiporter